MHPADHVKIAAGAITGVADVYDNEFQSPNRVLHHGIQRRLDSRTLNADDTPMGNTPFLHRALTRRPPSTLGAHEERRHAIDMTHPTEWNTPAWFDMLSRR